MISKDISHDNAKTPIAGAYFSWNVLNHTTLIKQGDRTFFEWNGSAVPKEIKKYFDADRIPNGGRKELVFVYLGKEYPGRLGIDSLSRCRIFWHTKLGTQFASHYNSNSNEPPLIRFEKISTDRFEIEFIDNELIESEKAEPFESDIIFEQEGRKKVYYVSKYERKPSLRQKAMQIHGTKCMICGFDFEATYGEAGRNFIEVHHLVPLSDTKEEINVNPETDLICVCSNCHRIIHRKKDGIYTPLEVRNMIKAEATSIE